MATHWNSQSLHPGPTIDRMSLKGLLRHAADEASEIIRSEANVIKLEIEESTRALITDALKAAAYSAVALLGLLSLLAFVIIGLADVITNAASPMTSVWLSALIIGVLLTSVGSAMAVRHAKRIGQDAQMKKTRSEVNADKALIKDEWKKL